ncbi:hypothetical protein EN780_24090 [Mesorhizobium sp. M4B.F.Ca.ET.089.01.1.1]|uniref:hypothetical protein n=1 Tax=Mesorhizobium sp. M4B.F.Ca.ET.089.01.1.1 TaxID=2496662 RepID=UPI000FE3EC44|nr:hypothetical protein [Mesorhizobium sp. M4B.F.Ca.ET.089.01.1.1]RWX63316.1 hypothetical protein EN780_24090 [Mesorhizobium sp. M4B.F.Ca.ET.089.01.1.1]
MTPQAKWKLANPKAVWAQNALRSAVKRGLVIQLPCEQCGSLDAEAHHPDYDRPMQVRWLCRLHHRRMHMRLNCQEVLHG